MILIGYVILDIIQNQYLSPTHPRTCSGSLEHAEFTENNIGHGFRFAKHTDYIRRRSYELWRDKRISGFGIGIAGNPAGRGSQGCALGTMGSPGAQK
jgi:hypothetical protein